MRCWVCEGQSGHKDYFGEWSECPCCNPDGKNETGETTAERLAEWSAEMAALDAEIDRQMHTPCPKCAVIIAECECGAQWATVQ